MRKGGFCAKVPCAVELAAIEVWLLDPQALSNAAQRITPKIVSNLNMIVSPLPLNEIAASLG
jgi:hypothetical protein